MNIEQSTEDLIVLNKKLTSEVGELKKTVEVLRNFEELFWLIFNNSNFTILVEQNGKCVFANKWLLRVSGYTYKELTSINVTQFIYPEDRGLYLEKDKRLKIGVMDSLIIRILLKNGEIVRKVKMDWFGFLLDNKLAKLVFVHDVTERIKTKMALAKEKELNELKSRFVSMASHEFRTPLTSILGAAEVMENYKDKLDDEKRQKYIDKIKTNIQQLTNLLNDVLLFEKIDAGKLKSDPEVVDLEPLLNEILEPFETFDTSHRIEISKKNIGYKIEIDPKLLRQIIQNLLSNALKYSTEKITINVEIITDIFIIKVKDYGIGIPPEDIKRLFEPFHRASNVSNFQGTGLGLTIINRAVDLLHGTIDVKSELGKGTLFRIEIPIAIKDK